MPTFESPTADADEVKTALRALAAGARTDNAAKGEDPRGALDGALLIVDEAQNLTPHEVKTILTRAGEGTKMVFTGDPYQIDNPYMDATNNGLVHVVNRFRPERIAGHVSMFKGERSELAELAANLL